MSGTSAELGRKIHDVLGAFPGLPMDVAARLVKIRQSAFGTPLPRMWVRWAEAEYALRGMPADAPYRDALLAAWTGAGAEALPAGSSAPGPTD